MRVNVLALSLVALVACAARSQTPTDGHTEANAYVNSYFHISYAWPKFLRPYDVSSLRLPTQSPYANEFLLFSARQGDEPFGVVMVAERLNARTPHSSGFKDGADFIDKVAQFPPQEHATIQARKHFANPEGLIFDELDYSDNGAPSSAIAAQVGQFLIVFKCSAKSPADLAVMIQSAISLHRR